MSTSRRTIWVGLAAVRATFCPVALLAAGCTATYTDPILPPDHPASASAPEAPARPRSGTLDAAGADPAGNAANGAAGRSDGGTGRASPAEPPSQARHEGGPAPSSSTPSAAVYACPMHPEVTSDKPDQRCPKCGMKLERQESRPGGGG